MMGHQTNAVTRALRMVDAGMTAYAAAKKTRIALSTIYRALKRREQQPVDTVEAALDRLARLRSARR
jgi:uncharacterized protein YfkK (UPF0435 family)